MSSLERAIDSKQSKIKETIDSAETAGLDEAQEKEKAVTAFIGEVDQLQLTLETEVEEPEMKEAFAKEVLDQLKRATSPEEIEKLQQELQTALQTYQESIQSYREWKKGKYLVKKGDDLSKIVEKELGIPWKEDPKTHFAIIRKIQNQRETEGSLPSINEDGEFELMKGSNRPDLLNIGEYLDVARGKAEAVPSIDEIRWYAQLEPKYGRVLNKVADELTVEETMQNEDEIEEDLSDTEIAHEEVRPSYIQTLQEKTDTYSKASEASARLSLSEDFEDDFVFDPVAQGNLVFFEKAIAAANAMDMWDDSDKEASALDGIQRACRSNLLAFSMTLEEALPKEMETEEYKKARKMFVEASKRFVELSANIDMNFESSAARDIKMAIDVANTMLPHMNISEAIRWTTEISAKIDSNDFQSDELKLDYMRLYGTIKANLKQKLAIQKQSGDPKEYGATCLELAQLFSDRGGPIDSEQCDSKWAAELAREAANMNAIVLQIAQNGTDILEDQIDMFQVISEERTSALDWLHEQEKLGLNVSGAIEVLETPLDSIENFAAMWAVIFQTQYLRDGEELPPDSEMEDTVVKLLMPMFETAQAHFEDYLEDTFWQKSPDVIQKELGITLDAQQCTALGLLNEIEGHGVFDLSDKTWTYVEMGAKITASIVVGVGVGVATGGLGFIPAALIGGAALTTSSALMYQKGFEDGAGGFVDAYGTEFAVNTATMGAARYLAAGRSVYQLNRAGILTGGLRSAEGQAILRLAGEKGGMRIIGSLDEGMTLGNRLMGAGLEGSADVLVGTTLDTVFTGGSFAENLERNAMFFGVGFGMEFGMPAMSRFVKGAEVADDASLAGIKGLNERGEVFRKNLKAEAKALGVEETELKKAIEDGTALKDFPYSAEIPALAREYHAIKTGYEEHLGQVLKLGELRELAGLEPLDTRQLSLGRKTDIETMEPKKAGELRVQYEENLENLDLISAKLTRAEALTDSEWDQLARMAEGSEFKDRQVDLVRRARTGDQGAQAELIAELIAGLRGEYDANIHALRSREKSIEWGKLYTDSVDTLRTIKDNAIQIGADLWEQFLVYWKRTPSTEPEPPLAPNPPRIQQAKEALAVWGAQLTAMKEKLPSLKDSIARLDLKTRMESLSTVVNQVTYNVKLLQFEWQQRADNSLLNYERFLENPDGFAKMDYQELQAMDAEFKQIPEAFTARIREYEACPEGHPKKALLNQKVALMRKALAELPGLQGQLEARIKKVLSDPKTMLDLPLSRSIITLANGEFLMLSQLSFVEAGGKQFKLMSVGEGIIFAEVNPTTGGVNRNGERRIYRTPRELLTAGIIDPGQLTTAQRKGLLDLGVDPNDMDRAHLALRKQSQLPQLRSALDELLARDTSSYFEGDIGGLETYVESLRTVVRDLTVRTDPEGVTLRGEAGERLRVMEQVLVKERQVEASIRIFYPKGLGYRTDYTIEQGQIGNCYHLASIDAIRGSNPALFRRMWRDKVKEMGNGWYQVDYGDKNLPIHLDQVRRFQTDSEKPSAKATLGDSLLEYANAAYHSQKKSGQRGQTMIVEPITRKRADEGGYAEQSMQRLLGSEYVSGAHYQDFATVNPHEILSVKAKNPTGVIVTLSSRKFNDLGSAPGSSNYKEARVWQGGREVSMKIWGNHAYSVVGYDATSGFVKIGNPHDTSKPFEVALRDVPKLFSGVNYVSLNPNTVPLALFAKNLEGIGDAQVVRQAVQKRLGKESVYTLVSAGEGDLRHLKFRIDQIVSASNDPVVRQVLHEELNVALEREVKKQARLAS